MIVAISRLRDRPLPCPRDVVQVFYSTQPVTGVP